MLNYQRVELLNMISSNKYGFWKSMRCFFSSLCIIEAMDGTVVSWGGW